MFACKTKMVQWMITKPLWVFSATLTCWGGRTPVYYVHTSTLYWTSSGRFVSPFIENISPSSHHHSSNNTNDTGQNEEDRDDKGELSCWGTSSTWGKQQTNDIWDIFKVTLTSDFPYLIQTSKQDCPGDQNNTWHFLIKENLQKRNWNYHSRTNLIFPGHMKPPHVSSLQEQHPFTSRQRSRSIVSWSQQGLVVPQISGAAVMWVFGLVCLIDCVYSWRFAAAAPLFLLSWLHF